MALGEGASTCSRTGRRPVVCGPSEGSRESTMIRQVPVVWPSTPGLSGRSSRSSLGQGGGTLYCNVPGSTPGSQVTRGFHGCELFWVSPEGIYPQHPDCGPDGRPSGCGGGGGGAPAPAAPPAAPAPPPAKPPTSPAPSVPPCCKAYWNPAGVWYMQCSDGKGAYEGPADPASIQTWSQKSCAAGAPPTAPPPAAAPPPPTSPAPAPAGIPVSNVIQAQVQQPQPVSVESVPTGAFPGQAFAPVSAALPSPRPIPTAPLPPRPPLKTCPIGPMSAQEWAERCAASKYGL